MIAYMYYVPNLYDFHMETTQTTKHVEWDYFPLPSKFGTLLHVGWKIQTWKLDKKIYAKLTYFLDLECLICVPFVDYLEIWANLEF
jgi:hypothetical protein